MSDAPPQSRPPAPRQARTDAAPWNWLLLLPLLLALYPPLYNHVDPKLFGLPFFYWYQLAIVPVSMISTMAVYAFGRGKASRNGRNGARP
jgi:hypothetical protein